MKGLYTKLVVNKKGLENQSLWQGLNSTYGQHISQVYCNGINKKEFKDTQLLTFLLSRFMFHTQQYLFNLYIIIDVRVINYNTSKKNDNFFLIVTGR